MLNAKTLVIESNSSMSVTIVAPSVQAPYVAVAPLPQFVPSPPNQSAEEDISIVKVETSTLGSTRRSTRLGEVKQDLVEPLKHKIVKELATRIEKRRNDIDKCRQAEKERV